jgi:hypothetical protein
MFWHPSVTSSIGPGGTPLARGTSGSTDLLVDPGPAICLARSNSRSCGTRDSFGCSSSGGDLAALGQRLNDFVSFAWGQEEIGLESVLTGVEIVVTAVQVVESLVTATFHDSSLFYD